MRHRVFAPVSYNVALAIGNYSVGVYILCLAIWRFASFGLLGKWPLFDDMQYIYLCILFLLAICRVMVNDDHPRWLYIADGLVVFCGIMMFVPIGYMAIEHYKCDSLDDTDLANIKTCKDADKTDLYNVIVACSGKAYASIASNECPGVNVNRAGLRAFNWLWVIINVTAVVLSAMVVFEESGRLARLEVYRTKRDAQTRRGSEIAWRYVHAHGYPDSSSKTSIQELYERSRKMLVDYKNILKDEDEILLERKGGKMA